MKQIFYFIILLGLFSCKQKEEIHYLDNNYPDLTPKIYAPTVFSLPDRFEHGIYMRQNGIEHYSLFSKRAWKYLGIIRYSYNNSGNLVIDTLTFQEHIKPKVKAILAGEATFSPDEKTMYFVADLPTDIWKSEINNEGKWGIPVKLDSAITYGESEWFPFIGSDNCLYYSKIIDSLGVIHKSIPENGEYRKAQVLDATFNYDCGEQIFNKEMNTVIFASPRDGGFGNLDLYVAFKNDKGTWTDGFNLGNEVNTPGWELAPYFSPDEKYLFFTRRDKFRKANSSDVYWVSMELIKNIQLKNVSNP